MAVRVKGCKPLIQSKKDPIKQTSLLAFLYKSNISNRSVLFLLQFLSVEIFFSQETPLSKPPKLSAKANPVGIEWLWSPIMIRTYLSLMACSKQESTREGAMGALQNITSGNCLVRTDGRLLHRHFSLSIFVFVTPSSDCVPILIFFFNVSVHVPVHVSVQVSEPKLFFFSPNQSFS